MMRGGGSMWQAFFPPFCFSPEKALPQAFCFSCFSKVAKKTLPLELFHIFSKVAKKELPQAPGAHNVGGVPPRPDQSQGHPSHYVGHVVTRGKGGVG